MQCEIEIRKISCRRSRSLEVDYAVSWSLHVVVLESTAKKCTNVTILFALRMKHHDQETMFPSLVAP